MLKIQDKIAKASPQVILLFGFASLILVGAILLSTKWASKSGETMRFLDALFTATSAVCVTGLAVVDTYDHFSIFGQVVILSLIQVGALGFMTFATVVFIVLGKRINLSDRILIQESMNFASLEGVVRLVKSVMFITFAIEGLGAVLLAFQFIPEFGWSRGAFYSIFHAVSAFCNAGFDLFGNFKGITGYVDNYLVSLTIATLLTLGGLGFSVYVNLWSYQHKKRLSEHSKAVLLTSFILIIFGFISFFLLEQNNPNTLGSLTTPNKWLASLFQGVTPRTAGFSTLNYADMNQGTILLTIILMFIGASPGSTGGGIKTTTMLILMSSIWSMARGKEDIVMFKRRVPASITYRAIAIFGFALLLVISTTFVRTSTEKQDFLPLLFEATSAFGTVGLSMGMTPQLSDLGRALIIFSMFVGRLGPLTIVIALITMEERKYRYPEAKLLIG